MSFKKKSPSPTSKNSIKKRVAENSIIIFGLAKKLGLSQKEVADKIRNGELKLR